MNQDRTWRDVVAEALQKLGGEGTLKEIAAIASEDPKAKNNTKVSEKVRQVVRAYKMFVTDEERSGIYRLVIDEFLPNIDKTATTKNITDEIQGKLLYIGRANDYETFAPSDDCTKRRFGGQPLASLVTVRENLADIPRLSEEERKRMSYIDVIWFAPVMGEFRPHIAFEIEHKTKIIEGLNRLNIIPDLFQTRLVIVGKDEKKKKKYDEFLLSPAFRPSAKRFLFKYFDEIRELFEYANEYQMAREENDWAMKDAGLERLV